MKNFTFNTAASLLCEAGSCARLGELCLQRNLRRPLLVTDGGVVAAGLLAAVVEPLHAAGLTVEVFDRVVADPPEAVVLDAVEAARASGADAVIGFGGGSSMDCAKLVALLASGEQSIGELYGVNLARGSRLPLIQIPTTAGTGSEVTAVAIVTTGEHTKSGVVAAQLLPDLALLDAELTVGLPAPITAATGIDAMVHAIEAYTGVIGKNPYSDMLAVEALRLLGGNIRCAVADGGNLAARQAMLLGACLAGQAFANSPVAAVHALAYPLGGHFHIPHGLSNALVLTEVMRFNAPAAAEHYAQLASAAIPGFVAGASVQASSERFIAALADLMAELGLPQRLSECGISASDLERLAEDALKQQRLLVNNPRPVSYDDALAIYRAAL